MWRESFVDCLIPANRLAIQANSLANYYASQKLLRFLLGSGPHRQMVARARLDNKFPLCSFFYACYLGAPE